ncbi:MAG: hypothetical protein JNL82_04460 [Myxococcales bacterium]|nr:hypothetical protein [Myxococcales bacterium]
MPGLMRPPSLALLTLLACGPGGGSSDSDAASTGDTSATSADTSATGNTSTTGRVGSWRGGPSGSSLSVSEVSLFVPV